MLAGCLALLGMVSLTVPALRLNEVLRRTRRRSPPTCRNYQPSVRASNCRSRRRSRCVRLESWAVEPIETKFASETLPFRHWRPVEISEGKQASNDLVLVGYCQDEQFQQAVAQLHDSGELTGRLVPIPKLDSSVGIVRPKWLGPEADSRSPGFKSSAVRIAAVLSRHWPVS